MPETFLLSYHKLHARAATYLPPALLVCGLLFSGTLIFMNLGEGSIDLWDEAITAGRSLYVYDTHRIINVEVNREISTRKPPLMYVLNAWSFQALGINQLGLRVPNALFGFGCFCILAFTTYRLCGSLWAGLSVWLLAGAYTLIEASREALTDTVYVLGFLCALAGVLFDLHRARDRARGSRCAYAFGVFLMLFGKGPVGLFLVAYVMLFLFVADRTLIRQYVLPTIAACAPLAAWMLLQTYSYPDFMRVFIGEEYLGRMDYGSVFLADHIGTPLWYVKRLWTWFRATGYLSLILAFTSLMSLRFLKMYPLSDARVLWFLTGTAAAYFIIFSLVPHKQGRYILPVFPVLTLLLVFSCAFLVRNFASRPFRYAAAVLIILSMCVGIYTTLHHYRSVPDYKPAEKAVTLRAAEYAKRGLPVFADNRQVAAIMHFYLRRPVAVVERPADARAERYVFVSGKAGKGSVREGDYYLTIVGDRTP